MSNLACKMRLKIRLAITRRDVTKGLVLEIRSYLDDKENRSFVHVLLDVEA